MFGIGYLFLIGRWMFDVGRSSFKPAPYGINATCEFLQNNLALMGFIPARSCIHAGLRAGINGLSRPLRKNISVKPDRH
jgi:hypothetical protein